MEFEKVIISKELAQDIYKIACELPEEQALDFIKAVLYREYQKDNMVLSHIKNYYPEIYEHYKEHKASNKARIRVEKFRNKKGENTYE